MGDVRTFCRVCEPACGLVARVEAGRLVSLKPDRAHPVSQGWACNKGLATFEVHHDPDRLSHPLKRTAAGTFERISWEQAIAEIAARMRAIHAARGEWATALYIGNPTAFNALVGVGMTPFVAGLGTRQIYSAGTQDCSNKFAASECVYGSSTVHPIPDFDHTNYLLILGSNPSVSHMSFISIADPINVLRAAQRRGAKIRFVNPRRIESVKSGVGELIQIRPDTDVYFLAALLHELERIGAFDDAVIAAYGTRIEGLRAFIKEYPPDRVGPVTGVLPETIREVASDWAAADGASVTMSTGVNMGRHGTLAYWLVHMLSFVTGNLNRKGGNIESIGYYPGAAASGRVRDPAQSFFDSRFGRVRHVRGSRPGNLLPDEILTSGDGQVRALFVVAGNPLLSMADESRMRDALQSLDLLICVDLYPTVTAQYAHYVLPATDQFERADLTYAGLGLQHRPHVQYTDAVVAPRDERREEWWIFARLCQALGFKSPLDEGEQPHLFGRLERMLERGGVTLEQLKATPGGVMLPPLQPVAFETYTQTSDGRIDCCPPLFADALRTVAADFGALAAEPRGRLRLITKRDRFMHNSWFHNIEKLKHGDRARNYLFMHPTDAQQRGLEDGDLVRLRSSAGAVELPVKHDTDLMPGVVAATHGWGHADADGMHIAHERPGTNVNRLLASGPGSFDPLSNMAFMTGVPVEVERVEAEGT
jgi:anaerobic selenocysteine-containing dehydrogenase